MCVRACVCLTEKGSEGIFMLDDGRALISSVSITALLLLRKYLIEMLLEEHVMSQTDELMCT